MAALAVAFGGAVGALARYGIALLLQALVPRQGLAGPLSTLSVNVLGSFLLAWLIFSPDLKMTPVVRLGLATGVLGAFTTFSTFELDLYRLLEGRPGWALLYLAGNLLLGFGAILLGRGLALRG